jgi:hypothetical protein
MLQRCCLTLNAVSLQQPQHEHEAEVTSVGQAVGSSAVLNTDRVVLGPDASHVGLLLEHSDGETTLEERAARLGVATGVFTRAAASTSAVAGRNTGRTCSPATPAPTTATVCIVVCCYHISAQTPCDLHSAVPHAEFIRLTKIAVLSRRKETYI